MQINFIKQVFFILTSGIPSVKRIDLQALTLAGPSVTRPVPEPQPKQPTIYE